jgi:hypothetical protein
MTPLHIEIMLHYYAMGDDFMGGDFSAPAVREFVDWLNAKGMIEPSSRDRPVLVAYVITDKGRAYVDYLCAVPLPVVKYVIEYSEGEK